MNVAVDKASTLAGNAVSNPPPPPPPPLASDDADGSRCLRWLVQEIIVPSDSASAAQLVAGPDTDPSQEVIARLLDAPLLATYGKHATILQTIFLRYSRANSKSPAPLLSSDPLAPEERPPPWVTARVDLAGFLSFAADFQLSPELVAGDHLQTIFEKCSLGLPAGLCYPTWCEAIGWSAMVVAEEQRFSGAQPPPPVDDVLELENLLAFMSQTQAAANVEEWLLGYTSRGLSPAFAWE